VLDLIDRRRNVRERQQVLQMRNQEVAHADGASATVLAKLLHRAPGVARGVRHRPVDQVEIDVVETQAGEAALAGRQRVVVALLVVPQLGGDEELVARDAACSDRSADAVLVAVHRGGVDATVPDLETPGDLMLDFGTRLGPERAEPEARHEHAGRDLNGVGERAQSDGVHGGTS
jgi:hypothetical protein